LVNGRKIGIHTKISHDGKEYSDGLLNVVQKQLKLSKANFNGLIDCPFTHEMYVFQLLEDGVLDEDDLI
jgi:hypothetical protein